MVSEREQMVLDSLRSQWERECDRLEKQLDAARANVEALRRVGAVPMSAPLKEVLPPQRIPGIAPKPNMGRGVSDGMRRYVETLQEGQHISAGECVRWMLANGVDGEYNKLMNQMPGLLKKESQRDSSVQKDPAGGYKKRKTVLTIPLGAVPVRDADGR